VTFNRTCQIRSLIAINKVPSHSPPCDHSTNDPHPTNTRLHSQETLPSNSPTLANPAIALPPSSRSQLLDPSNPELQPSIRRRFAQHSASVRALCCIATAITENHEPLIAPRRLPSPGAGRSLPHERHLRSWFLVVGTARSGSRLGGIGESLGCPGSLDRVCGLGSLVAWLGSRRDLCLVWGVLIVLLLAGTQ